MSYQEQAEKMNSQFNKYFDTIVIEEQTKKDIINLILWFGQVAKFRCRSNTAYGNFCREVFRNIAELERVKDDDKDFEKLQVMGDKNGNTSK